MVNLFGKFIQFSYQIILVRSCHSGAYNITGHQFLVRVDENVAVHIRRIAVGAADIDILIAHFFLR